MNNIDSQLKLDFLKIYPIEVYSGYSKNLQYSDKIVLPMSVCYALVRAGIHFPPIFLIHSKENYNISALCAVLEYSSEPDTLYCPNVLLKKLRIKPSNKVKGGGVILEIQSHVKNKYPFAELTKIIISTNAFILESICRRGLLGYTIIKTGDNLTVIKNLDFTSRSRNKTLYFKNISR